VGYVLHRVTCDGLPLAVTSAPLPTARHTPLRSTVRIIFFTADVNSTRCGAKCWLLRLPHPILTGG